MLVVAEVGSGAGPTNGNNFGFHRCMTIWTKTRGYFAFNFILIIDCFQSLDLFTEGYGQSSEVFFNSDKI